MKIAVIGTGLASGQPVVYDSPDIATMQNVDGKGTTQAASASITLNRNHTVAVCRHVDASNFGVSFTAQPIVGAGSITGDHVTLGAIVEVYAEQGNITVYPDSGSGTFLNGASSVVVASGAKFMLVWSASAGAGKWAFLS